MKKIILCTLALTSLALFSQEYKIDFTAKSGRFAAVRNYGNKLEIKNGILKKKPATIVTLAKDRKEKTDTAFALISEKVPVKGKKTITLNGEILIPAKLTVGGTLGTFRNAVHFFDAKGKPCKDAFVPFKVPVGTGAFMPFQAVLTIPSGAVTATIQLGYDYPDFRESHTFAVSKLLWTVK